MSTDDWPHVSPDALVGLWQSCWICIPKKLHRDSEKPLWRPQCYSKYVWRCGHFFMCLLYFNLSWDMAFSVCIKYSEYEIPEKQEYSIFWVFSLGCFSEGQSRPTHRRWPHFSREAILMNQLSVASDSSSFQIFKSVFTCSTLGKKACEGKHVYFLVFLQKEENHPFSEKIPQERQWLLISGSLLDASSV